jgi:YaiO family outer membrane protein
MMSPLFLTSFFLLQTAGAAEPLVPPGPAADPQETTAPRSTLLGNTAVQAKVGVEYDDYAEGLPSANGVYVVADLIGAANRWTFTGESWRKFGEVANRGGVGFTRKFGGGRWLRLGASMAPDATVIAEQDYSVGVTQALPRGWVFNGDYRVLQFQTAEVDLLSSTVEYYLKRPIWLSATIGKTFTEFLSTGVDADNQFLVVRYNQLIGRALTLHLGGATGSEPISTLSVDRIGEFEADTFFVGADYDFSPGFGISVFVSDQSAEDRPDLQVFNFALTVRK